ncbi:MAG: hypothetical protein DF168_00918 [Candidatus Moanabacter tarae]|uniref:Uncharacterized protein n=1 Tax=Candidatus Moanibacter tarae TaxID=2200854 RepID=A0A2Z4AHJ9_9BACT|nr:MAG: hypothetical protein DF168_00918 [Candidatus Moanabacter tarae]|tara:strand:+ start:10730 stop:11137 length:408 start_codon:yes stop_codon:yes gene_type:complete
MPQTTDRTNFKLPIFVVHTSNGESVISSGRISYKYLLDGIFFQEVRILKGSLHKPPHNAVPDNLGPLTHIHTVLSGGFTIYFGPDDASQHFGLNDVVAFINFNGRGHSSRVDGAGCTRLFQTRRGLINLEKLEKM